MIPPEDCTCCCGQPIAYTIQIGDEPPTFHVNTGVLEALAEAQAARFAGEDALSSGS